MAGWFLVSYSCSQMVRPFLRGASSRLPGSLEASGQLVCLYSGCRHPVSKVEITSPFLTWPWKPHCMVFLVPGKAQTHLGLRRGHWLPSLDGIGQEILLWVSLGKRLAMIYPLATINSHLSHMQNIWLLFQGPPKVSCQYGFRLRLSLSQGPCHLIICLTHIYNTARGQAS